MSAVVKERKLTWAYVLLSINLICIFLYIFSVLLNYDLSWMQFEKLKTHIWILENGKEWQWSDLAKALNTKIIEIDPNRLSRPLSNLVEVIDAKFRANLWDYIPPHPTLSLQWPFLFIGLPLLLYRLFRNLDCHPLVALAGMSLYLTSSGFLSPIVQISHPAKNMVNFFLILTLVVITRLHRNVKANMVSIREIPNFWLIMISSMFLTLITFFSDETGVFLFLILGIVLYPLMMKFKEKAVFLAWYLSLPIIYFIIIHFFLPWLHYAVNHKAVDLGAYRDFPHISSLFFPNLHDLFINFYLLFSVHPGLKWYFVPILNHPFVLSLQCVYTLAFLFITVLFIYTVNKTKKITARLKQVLSGCALLVIFVYFHTFQLSHNVRTWPVFWYGCLFSLIYYPTLTLLLQYIWEGPKGNFFKTFLPFIIVIFTAHGLMSSTYLTRIFKNQSYLPGTFYYPSMFDGKITPYEYFDMSKSFQSSRCRYIYTLLYWSQVKHKNVDRNAYYNETQACLPLLTSDPFARADLAYIVIEAAYEFPLGRSFLNDPAYVASWMHQTGEAP